MPNFDGKPLWQQFSGKQRESVSWTAALSNPLSQPHRVITSLNETPLHVVLNNQPRRGSGRMRRLFPQINLLSLFFIMSRRENGNARLAEWGDLRDMPSLSAACVVKLKSLRIND